MTNSNDKDTTDLKMEIMKAIDEYFGQATAPHDIAVKTDFVFDLVRSLSDEHKHSLEMKAMNEQVIYKMDPDLAHLRMSEEDI